MVVSEAAPPAREASKKLAGVQVARCVAALLVVVFHATRSVSLPQYVGYIPFGNIVGFGHAEVDFFFVLSGFIITHAHAADLGRPDRLYRYLWRRLIRIYPIYWFVTSIELARAAFAPDAAIRLAPLHVIQSLLLLPDSKDPLVNVAWTLRSEMLFYLVFALVVFDRRLTKVLVIGTVLLVLAGVIAGPSTPGISLLMTPFNIEFLIGIAVANFLAGWRVPIPAAFVAAGVVGFLGVGGWEDVGGVAVNGLFGRLLYGGASAAILVGLVGMEKRGSMRLGIAAVMLGDMSYCLYLIHLTIIPLTVRFCALSGLLWILPAGVIVLGLVIVSVVLAVALHLGVEIPMMSFLRARTPRAFR